MVQHCAVDVGSEEILHIFSLHLPVESRRSRMRGASEALDFISDTNASKFVAGGDMNNGPYEGPLWILKTIFHDTWENAKSKHINYGNKDVYSHEAIRRIVDANRIDYILGQNGSEVKNITYIFDDLEPIALSDHPLVLVEF